MLRTQPTMDVHARCTLIKICTHLFFILQLNGAPQTLIHLKSFYLLSNNWGNMRWRPFQILSNIMYKTWPTRIKLLINEKANCHWSPPPKHIILCIRYDQSVYFTYYRKICCMSGYFASGHSLLRPLGLAVRITILRIEQAGAIIHM